MKVIGVKIKVKDSDKTEMKLQASLIAIFVILYNFPKSDKSKCNVCAKVGVHGGGAVDCKTCGRSGNRT